MKIFSTSQAETTEEETSNSSKSTWLVEIAQLYNVLSTGYVVDSETESDSDSGDNHEEVSRNYICISCFLGLVICNLMYIGGKI